MPKTTNFAPETCTLCPRQCRADRAAGRIGFCGAGGALKAARADFDQPPMAEYNVGCIIGINTGPDMIGILYRR